MLSPCSDAGFRNYEAARQFADARAVSRLSPFLHFGQLSPRLVIAEARKRGGMSMSKTFMRRLVWRDLSYWQLHHWPAMALHPIREHYGGQVLVSLSIAPPLMINGASPGKRARRLATLHHVKGLAGPMSLTRHALQELQRLRIEILCRLPCTSLTPWNR